ncbi:MAG: Na+/H+ antiporter NhaA [Thiotrichales bacterium]|jgi:NhaA family Na+:H+ antiporter|nr:Na+/H+ antiporter NhaA [Thiotrichales bacterium]
MLQQHPLNKDSARFIAPFEPVFNRLRSPFDAFVHNTIAGGLLLMLTAILALICANSLLSQWYSEVFHIHLSIQLGAWGLDYTLHHWINDGLMTLFFFVVGLELKRELLVGELAEPKQAMLPILAAIGGMIFPALIYWYFNPSGEATAGWGVPMATDIAFALGVISLLAGRIPKALIAFLVALAIVDDLGAVLVIAVFYTEQLSAPLLMLAGIITLLLILMNRSGIRHPIAYFIVAIALWLTLLNSGVHATIAGVITAFTIPALPRYNTRAFSQQMRSALDSFDRAAKDSSGNLLRNHAQFEILQRLEHKVQGVATPLQRLEHSLNLPVAFLVLPIFAFANAGITIDFDQLVASLNHPVTQGVLFGLLFGKLIGIALVSIIAIKLGLAKLPQDVTFTHIIGVALLGGIGFTMAIFIAEIGFQGQPTLIIEAKIGIFLASLIAGVVGYAFLKTVIRR